MREPLTARGVGLPPKPNPILNVTLTLALTLEHADGSEGLDSLLVAWVSGAAWVRELADAAILRGVGNSAKSASRGVNVEVGALGEDEAEVQLKY